MKKRIIMIQQEKGGSSKTTACRALSEAVPAAGILELDIDHRLREYGKRVRFFPQRADRMSIEKSGGRASVSEFDAIVNEMFAAQAPLIVDVGANTAISLAETLATIADELDVAGIELGVVIVTTAEPDALSQVPRLLELAGRCRAKKFVLANHMRGPIDLARLSAMVGDASIAVFANQIMDEVALSLIATGGLAGVTKLDRAALVKEFGPLRGSRVHAQCMRFRSEAMEAILEPARWLVGGE
jgi:hypothetical protein